MWSENVDRQALEFGGNWLVVGSSVPYLGRYDRERREKGEIEGKEEREQTEAA